MAKQLYYKIGEACKRLDIQPYVLRYWETEFPVLKPGKSKSGQRVYTEGDLRVIRRIKELLYEEGYTIAGAKKKLGSEDLAAGDDGADAAATAAPAKPAPKPAKKPEKKPAAAKRATAAKRAPAKKASPSEARLRAGVRRALEEARAILELLDSGTSKR